jgi:hypothetical protein
VTVPFIIAESSSRRFSTTLGPLPCAAVKSLYEGTGAEGSKSRLLSGSSFLARKSSESLRVTEKPPDLARKWRRRSCQAERPPDREGTPDRVRGGLQQRFRERQRFVGTGSLVFESRSVAVVGRVRNDRFGRVALGYDLGSLADLGPANGEPRGAR